MAAFLSLVPTRDVAFPPAAASARADLRLVPRRPQPAARPHLVAVWHRAVDGRLTCRWQPADPDPDPLPSVSATAIALLWSHRLADRAIRAWRRGNRRTVTLR